MKVRFKGPVQGQPFRFQVNGKGGGSSTWGVAAGGGMPGAFPATVQRTAYNARTVAVDVLSEAPAEADSLVLLGQPASGRATVREDGKVTVDLTDYLGTTALTVPYRATKSGGGSVDGVLMLAIQNTQICKRDTGALQSVPRWWGRGRHYVLPVNAYDEVVVERHPTARIWHCSNTGLSRAQIGQRERANGNQVSDAQITDAWIYANLAAAAVGGVRYGETEALALAPSVVQSLLNSYMRWYYTPHQIYFHRGETITIDLLGQGLSRRYPVVYGAYGDRASANPIIVRATRQTDGEEIYFNYATCVVLQNLSVEKSDYGGGVKFVNCEWIVCDGIRRKKAPLDVDGGGVLKRGITIRRDHVLDNFHLVCNYTETDNGVTMWSVPNNRTDAIYLNTCDGALVEKGFSDMAGWAMGYAYDSRSTAPQPPSNRSHSIYAQYANLDVSIRDYLSSRPANSAIQHRCGGIVDNCLFFGGGGGINPQGWMGDGTHDWPTLAGSFSMLYNVMLTMAGQHDAPRVSSNPALTYPLYRADGLRNQAHLLSTDRTVIAHVGPGNPIAEFGPCGPARWPDDVPYTITVEGSEYAVDAAIYKWTNGAPNQTKPGASTAAMDAATLDGWISTYRGTSTTGQDAVATYLRTLAEPWTLIRPALRDLIPAYGYAAIPLRTVAATVRFQPQANGGTPGIRADIEADWSTKDLPGTAAGDSIALTGHRVHWAINPANSIANLDFGGGELVMWGGTLKPAGTVSGGGRLVLDYVSDFQCAGYAGADLWTVVVQGDGRFTNAGVISGPVDLTVRNGAEAVLSKAGGGFTLQAGRRLTLEGGSAVTAAGGVAFAAGSTLRLTTGQTIWTTGRSAAVVDPIHAMPVSYRIGSTVTGATSGATATVLDVRERALSDAILCLGDVTGTFVAGETLSGLSIVGWQERGAAAIGTVNGAPAAKLIPVLVSTGTVTLGGTLDVSGLPVGTHTIVTAASITGSFAAIVAGIGRSASVDTTEVGVAKVTIS